MKSLEVIFDTEPSGGCGCNCGCGGASKVEDMNNLIDELKTYEFQTDLNIDVLPISDMEKTNLINKINSILENTQASFRADEDNVEDILSDILPLVVLDNNVITAYGVPTLNDVVSRVDKTN